MKLPLCFAFVIISLAVSAAENLVPNGGFEPGTNGWRTLARSAAALTARWEEQETHSGRGALRLEHTGAEDWSLEPAVRLQASPGDVVQLECWVRVERGEGTVSLCSSTWDRRGEVVEWSAGERLATRASGWQHLATGVLVSAGVAQVQPRLIGYGPIVAMVDDYSARFAGNVSALRPANLSPSLQLTNASLVVTFNTTDAVFTARSPHGSRLWSQKPYIKDFVVTRAEADKQPGRLRFSLVQMGSGLEARGTMTLDPSKPELVVELAAEGPISASVPFPHPFVGEPAEYLVVPMNEGISYPVDDPSIGPMRLIAYGGHGICMAFFGVTDGAQGHMAILETPDDAAIRITRLDGRLAIVPEWDPQCGEFGYTRRVRYIFFDQGGHVAMAKRYRAHAKETGLFATLDAKRKSNPNVDRLMGAVNVWCWDRDGVGLAKEMKAAGIERILWSNQQSPERLASLNELGVLTSRYDIYQDVMAATNFPRLRWIHPDWTTNAWPGQIIVDSRGQWLRGWGVESRDGPMIPCGVLCDRFGPQYARQRVPTDLATHPYLCRFIDTTTAAPWNECYDPKHPMTRTESRHWKMELLRYIAQEEKLVTGSETGHDAAVPYVDYFEGMMSLGPYRVPDAGRRMSEIWTNVPEAVARFQLGQKYRLPLWELVYHDCVVAHWYWGDYNNKLPALWDKRDLFNLLYGVPPMFMFDRSLWESSKTRFVRSYQDTCPHIRRVGYQEMTDHVFLTRDRNVQQTKFANGMAVTVNFGESEFRPPRGPVVPSMSFRVEGEPDRP